eukprot:GHVU01235792.1.p1 GENE.GHVU01235792.1~~GHVU01235792.1.p1  ORF type:complete len:534 (+),score=50.01 GHVU01235792.1:474-2075(+)
MGKFTRQRDFGFIGDIKRPRSQFDRSSDLKTTFDGDYIIPIFLDEILPGDTMNMNCSIFARFNSPLVRPILDNVYLKTYWFWCPMRLLWDNSKKFFGEQIDPDDSTDFTIPHLDITSTDLAGDGIEVGTLGDYLGLPTEVPGIEVSALPYRMYNLVYNEFFRDQNLHDSLTVDLGDADSDTDDYVLKKKCKSGDYFTTALPWAQKNFSGVDVTIPLGTKAPIVYEEGLNKTGYIRRSSSDALADGDVTSAGTGKLQVGIYDAYYDPNTTLYADLNTATSASLLEFRQVVAMQQYYENLARGGSRYHEGIQVEFGVSAPHEQYRPEFLGSGTVNISINTVPNTSHALSAANPVGVGDTYTGELTAFGTGAGNNGWFKSFNEHGYVMGVVCAVADITMQEGIDRLWTRETIFDFYHPDFEGIGDEAILKSEIYAQGTSQDNEAWAYQERFANYKYKPSKITGSFRSSYTTSLDVEHLSQEFGSLPTFNAAFIESNTPFDRIVSVPGEHHFKIDANFDYKCIRRMRTFCNPGLRRI